jgi:hypothetical protein
VDKPSSARLRREETRIIAQRQWKLPPSVNIDGQFSCEFWSDRYEPCLVKLCVANGDNPLYSIDVAQGQIESFANRATVTIT